MDMTGYTKLFGSIVASTIWREPNEVRILWITMLALANKDGIVEASVPGLADLARLTLDECEEALEALSSPDKYSRTPDHEGRRIAKCDGGWSILNHAKYRAKMSMDERREYLRLKQQEHRAKQRPGLPVNVGVNNRSALSTSSTHAEEDSEAAPEAKATPTLPAARVVKELKEDESFNQFWQAYPKRVAKGYAEKAWEKMKCRAILPQILTAIRAAKISDAWTKEYGKFIPHPATWLNAKGWEDDHTPPLLQIPAKSKEVDPPGWREWLTKRGFEYEAHEYAPKFRRDDFKGERK